MRFWISLVNTVEVDQFIAIAQKAEELGYEGVTLPDHLVYPATIETPYPYTDDGKVWWPNTTPWADPWVTITAMGVATSTLRFATNIYLAALRDPFTVSRATSAAAIYTDNRVACGVSAGWLKARGRRLDEVIACVRALNTGETVSHDGEFYRYDDVIMSPVPSKPVPFWVGGKSRPALRRAAENDGWLGVPLGLEEMKAVIDSIFDQRRENGKYEEPFDVVISAMEAYTPEFVESLDPAGTYHASVLPWTPSPWGRAFWVEEGEDHTTLEVKVRAMERFKDMMSKFGLWD
jgi:alkanesulfonate monooxygenase SsuD/methylene tetrahydromethanopterin reductase-like flavin-dependent oxidoreductase (luciferase family)